MYMYMHTKDGLLVLKFFCTGIATQLEGRGKAVGTVLPPAAIKESNNGLIHRNTGGLVLLL